MELDLTGKTALVTGASAGLGAACAQSLAAEGAMLIVCARSEDKLKTIADRIQHVSGRSPQIIVADLSTSDGLASVASSITDLDIDILVSNAGGPPPGKFLDHEESAWSAASRLVLDMAVGLTRLVLPGMVERQWGRLLYITSVGVLQPVDDLILSNAYRAGVTGLCKTLSNTYARHGITANCVCPGYTATERLSNLAQGRAAEAGVSPEDILSEFASSIPAGRVGRPEELGDLVAFLASDRAAYITGTSIPVDGGYHRSLL